MITEVLAWGLQPEMVTGDAWYSSRENLKFLKNRDLGIFMGIAKNRKVSFDGLKYTQVKNLEIPDSGLVMHLKNFGRVMRISEDLQKRIREILYHVPT